MAFIFIGQIYLRNKCANELKKRVVKGNTTTTKNVSFYGASILTQILKPKWDLELNEYNTAKNHSGIKRKEPQECAPTQYNK